MSLTGGWKKFENAFTWTRVVSFRDFLVFVADSGSKLQETIVLFDINRRKELCVLKTPEKIFMSFISKYDFFRRKATHHHTSDTRHQCFWTKN